MAGPASSPRRIFAALSVAASVLAGGAFGGTLGCYSEPQPPPTYRYACSADGDCGDGEGCREGICERLCTQVTFPDDCGSTQALCFNGACTNTCELDAGTCPSAQECVDLSVIGIDLSGGGGGFGGSSAPLGVCGRMCEAGDGLCPESELCFQGFCVAMCEVGGGDEQCPAGLECTALGLCAPPGALEDDGGDDDDGGPVGDVSSTGDSSTGDSSTGDSSTGDLSTGGATGTGTDTDTGGTQ